MKQHVKPNRTERVIQFGEGGFLRGFADWILQITHEVTDWEGSVVVVQPIEKGLCETLEAQNCVYTHLMRGLKQGSPTVEKKIIDVISRTVRPYDDWEAYMKLAEQPALRFVISNTTESGIVYREGDALSDAPPVSFPAKVTALLWRRFTLGLDGFIFLPCELIEHNGDSLKAIILQYAAAWGLGDAFALWVCEHNRFYNTLVDRIVTGYPRDEHIELGYEDAMLNTSELFHLWVLEGDPGLFEELPLDRLGLNIVLTDNLEPYRTRKVRILNGAHTAMIPYALLEGVETVGACMEDQTLSEFVRACVFEEIIPTLDLPKAELIDYAENVFERFRNPFIKHLCASISLNSVSKFRVRVLPSILEYERRFGKEPVCLILSLAKLIEFYKRGTPTDDAEVIRVMKEGTVEEILSNTSLWGTDLSHLASEVKKYGHS